MKEEDLIQWKILTGWDKDTILKTLLQLECSHENAFQFYRRYGFMPNSTEQKILKEISVYNFIRIAESE